MENMENIMRELIEYAYKKMMADNAYPFACFVVKDGVVIARSVNSKSNSYTGDHTQHGEMEALRQALRALDHKPEVAHAFNEEGYALYSTCEPCLACFDAALWTGMKTFVFSVGQQDFPEYFNHHNYTLEDHQRDNPGRANIYAGVLYDQGVDLFKRAKVKYGW